MNNELESLKYPIGKREYKGSLTASELSDCVKAIADLPLELKNAVENLTDEQLDTPYRPDGWTVRQVVHHLCDSHMNAFIRCKLMLTENHPTIKAYDEAAWAQMEDCRIMPVEPGLRLLAALHTRWEVLLKGLGEGQLKSTYLHPQYGKVFEMKEVIHLYAWHGKHHLAHITGLKKNRGWS